MARPAVHRMQKGNAKPWGIAREQNRRGSSLHRRSVGVQRARARPETASVRFRCRIVPTGRCRGYGQDLQPLGERGAFRPGHRRLWALRRRHLRHPASRAAHKLERKVELLIAIGSPPPSSAGSAKGSSTAISSFRSTPPRRFPETGSLRVLPAGRGPGDPAPEGAVGIRLGRPAHAGPYEAVGGLPEIRRLLPLDRRPGVLVGHSAAGLLSR